MTGLLEFRRYQIVSFFRCNGKGYQRWRNMHVVVGTGHRVLAADCCAAEHNLCIVCTEQSCKRCAELLRITVQMLEIFLEGQVCRVVITASGYQTSHRFNNGAGSAQIRVLLHIIRIKAKAHNRGGGALSSGRQGCRHNLCRGQLILTAIRHKYGACADRTVKALGQAALQTDVQLRGQVQDLLLQVCALGRNLNRRGRQRGYMCLGVLGSAVGVEEVAGYVNDGVAVPSHAQTIGIGNNGNNRCFDVLLVCHFDELLHVLLGYDNCHTLLRLGDSQLGAVQTVILLRYGVQIDVQTVCQLADGNGYTACAKVVAAANHAGCLRIAEQTLNLALFRRIALLYLCAAGLQRFGGVALGRTGCTAAAVTTGAAAEQDDNIARIRHFTNDVFNRCCADNCADFHALCDIARMINLMNQAGSQTDLVAVRRITGSGSGAQLALRQLVLQRLAQRNRRIACTGHTHCLIYIASTGQRIANCAAKAGSSAAKRFDFCRMVMGFVFKHEQPRLFFAVYGCIDADGASVDFFALVQIRQAAALLEHFACNGADIHQRNRTLSSLLLAVYFHAACQIAVVRVQYHLIVDCALVNLGQEGGVTTVIRPIGVDHAHFCDGRVALFFPCEIALQELQVIQLHCQTQTGAHLLQCGSVHGNEALYGVNFCRDCIVCFQRLRLCCGGLAGVNRIDEIAADLVQLFIGQLAAQHIDMGCCYLRTLALCHQLDTLRTGIRALIVLTRQRFNRENAAIAFRHRILLIVAIIYHRLREHDVFRLCIGFCINAFHIVAAQLTHVSECWNLQQFTHAAAQRLGCTVETLALFRIAS